MLIQQIYRVKSNFKLLFCQLVLEINLDVIESEKCMCNLIYMSPAVQKFYSVSGVADAITQRIKETTTTKLDNGIRFYDMRMLFLLTALNADIK